MNLRLRIYAEITGSRKELTEGRFYPPKGDFSRRDTEFETNSLLLHQNQRHITYTYIRPRGVSNGGFNGVWYNAGFGWVTDAYDDSKEGFLFDISSPSTTWYPLTGCRDYYDASLYQVSKYGYFWTASPGDEHRVYCLYLNPSASGYPVNTMYDKGRASGLAIRCVKE